VSGTSLERLPSHGAPAHSAPAHGAPAPAHQGIPDSSISLGLDEHSALVPLHDEDEQHSSALVRYNPDAPSEEWGWHGHWSDFAPRGRNLLLGLGVVGLLLMVVIGNHQSHVEDYFLVLSAVAMAAWMVRGTLAKKRERRIKP